MTHTTTGPEPALSPEFRGEQIHRGDAAYDTARAIYNGSIDRRPEVVLRPRGAADVADAIGYARAAGLPLSVRCGGHAVAGTSLVEGGVLIDLSAMKGVHVDRQRGTAVAQGGALWGEYDRDTQLLGLATPGGRVTTTGVGGFALGGGYAWLSRKHGLTCDNLVGADLVTADGRLVHVSEEEYPELMWGLRGAGANFGVVTAYEFKVHALGPVMLAGMLVLPNQEGTAEVVRAARAYAESAPDEVIMGFATLLAPPEPFVPPELVGKPVFGIVGGYAGDVAAGEEELSGLRRLVGDVGGMDLMQPMPYTAFQAMLDPFSPPGWQNYHRGFHISGLTDEVIDSYLEVGRTIHSPMTQGVVFCHGGAISRVPEDATAASNRSAPYMAHPISCWRNPHEAEYEMDWVRRFTGAFDPVATGVTYLNFEPTTSEESVRSGFSADKYERLVALKDEWDPTNVFRSNHNIAPSGTQAAVPQPS